MHLEPISFMLPESHYLPSSPSHDMRHNHPWANKANGWLAYTFPSVSYATPPLSTILSVHLQAAGSETHYELEVPDERTRPDIVEIKWDVSAPTRRAEKKGPSPLPSFCIDITPPMLHVRHGQEPHLQVPKKPYRMVTTRLLQHLKLFETPTTGAYF